MKNKVEEKNLPMQKKGKSLKSKSKISALRNNADEKKNLFEQIPQSDSESFYIKEVSGAADFINTEENNKKLALMSKILGDELTLRKGESRSGKIYRLTYTFNELLDIAISENVDVSLNQVNVEELSEIRAERGENCIYVKSEEEFYVWTFLNDKSGLIEKASGNNQLRKKRERKKKFLEFQKENPLQLSLFRLIDKEKDYSHTIELYDFIPKYVWGKSKRIEGKFLEPITREFICKKVPYRVVLMPARIQTETGDFLDYFPSKREELVEDALRKIMSDAQGVFLDDAAGTTFTLYQLQTELKNRGHSYSYDQLKKSLEILAKTDIELESADKETKIIFRAIETLGLSGKEGETQTFVRFSPLVTQSIKKGSFRLINYEKVMSYKTVIARQLHKRMSHFYTQASLTEKYQILLSTIIRDFGLTRYAQLRNNLLEVEKGAEELKEKNVIVNCITDKVFDANPKTKLSDAKFTFLPHPFFVEEIKKANLKNNSVKEKMKLPSSDYE